MAPLQEERGLAYIGTMGWSYSFWAGRLYPEYVRQNDYLAEYAKHFNSVEIDATFYKIPSVDTVKNWVNKVPEEFKFSVKFPRSITHAPNLAYDREKLEVFLERINRMGEKLGPLLLQLPPYTRLNMESLTRLIDGLPTRNLYAIEFRNSSWYTDDVFSLLRDRGVSLVITDRQGAAHELTSDFAYFRWEGDRKPINGERGVVEQDRSVENKVLANDVRKVLGLGFDVYCYFSKYYGEYDMNSWIPALALKQELARIG